MSGGDDGAAGFGFRSPPHNRREAFPGSTASAGRRATSFCVVGFERRLIEKLHNGTLHRLRAVDRTRGGLRPLKDNALTALVEVKSLGGVNFVRPDRVIAVQTSATGTTVIVMEGGSQVNSSETTAVVAARLTAAGAQG